MSVTVMTCNSGGGNNQLKELAQETIGMITPNDVTTPGVLVDDLIQNLPHRH